MKRILVFTALVMGVHIGFAQSYHFVSFQYRHATQKGTKWQEAPDWVNDQNAVTLNLDKNQLLISSDVTEEFDVVRTTKKYLDDAGHVWMECSGIDSEGNECIIKIELISGTDENSEGNLYLQYENSMVIYRIRGDKGIEHQQLLANSLIELH